MSLGIITRVQSSLLLCPVSEFVFSMLMLAFADRYMKENIMWTTQRRAEIAMAEGSARRLKERIDGMTVYKVGPEGVLVAGWIALAE